MSESKHAIVLETADPIELQLASNLLEQAGIPSVVESGSVDSLLSTYLGSGLPILTKLMVLEDRAGDAARVLEEAWGAGEAEAEEVGTLSADEARASTTAAEETNMTISESLLPEFDYETASTRKVIERLPDDKFAWKPHAKSMNAGALATHLASTLTWAARTLESESIDIAPPNAPPPRMTPPTSRKEVLAAFDANVIAARAAIAKASDAQWTKSWTLLAGGKPLFTAPRIAAVRSFILNHSIHHRAQLGLYLRMNDIAVPAIYGPTADESGMG